MLLSTSLMLLTLGACWATPHMSAEDEQKLIDYVIELYYYPNRPEMKEYPSPEKYPGHHKRHYFYDYINPCMKESHALGVIHPEIHSHTICISLCHDYPQCVGGLHSKPRNRCYLLKYVECHNEKHLPPNYAQSSVTKALTGEWQVFFFYLDANCTKPNDKNSGQTCNATSTTTMAPTMPTTPQREKEGEKSREKVSEKNADKQQVSEQQSEQVSQQEGIRQSATEQQQMEIDDPMSIAVMISRTVVKPAERVAAMNVEYKQHRHEFSKTSSKVYRYKRLNDEAIKETVQLATGAKNIPSNELFDIDKALNDFEKHEKAESVRKAEAEAKRKFKDLPQRQASKHLASQQKVKVGAPAASNLADDFLDLPDIPSDEPLILVADCSEGDRVPLLADRRKRSAGRMAQCKKFVKKLRKTIRKLQAKFNFIKSLFHKAKGGPNLNMLEEIKTRIQNKFDKIKTGRFRRHMTKVGKAAGLAGFICTADMLIDDIKNGHFDRVAMSLGYILLTVGSSWLSVKASAYATKLLAKAQLKAAIFFKIIAPFIQTISVALVAYEFYKSMADLNTSDPDTVAFAIANGILLGVELFELGVLALASFGVISASTAAATSGILVVVVVAVFAGLRIYQAVRQVAQIKEKVDDMSHGEIAHEGWLRFWGTKQEHIERIYHEKSANEDLRDIAIKALNNSEILETYFMPAVIHEEGKSNFAKERIINLTWWGQIQPSRSSPRSIGNFETICLPQGNNEVNNTEKIVYDYYCEQAFGVKDTSSNNKTANHFHLIDGTDRVFAKNVTNTYSIANGIKEINGGYGQDIFILHGNDTSGHLDGNYGYDKIIAEEFHLDVQVNYRLNDNGSTLINHFDFESGHRKYIEAMSIEDLRGRSVAPDAITIPCNLSRLNARGGQDKIRGRDKILLKDDCQYNITIIVGDNTIVTSNGNGRIIYLFSNMSGHSFINLKKYSYQNIFIFDYYIDQLLEIKKTESTYIKFKFMYHENHLRFSYVTIKNYDNQTVFAFKENVVLRTGDTNGFLTTISNLKITDLRQKYKQIADKHGLIVKAKSNADKAALVMGHGLKQFGVKEKSMKNVLSNDKTKTTYFYPGSVKNVYLIATDERKYNESIENFSIPNIIINYEQAPAEMDEIELSILAHKLMTNFNAKLHIEAESENSTNDINIQLYAIHEDDENYTHIGQIQLKNVTSNSAYEKIKIAHKSGLRFKTRVPVGNAINETNSNISLNPTSLGRPMDDAVNATNSTIILEPIPLSFSEEYEVIVITEHDVFEGSTVNINKDVIDYDYFRYNNTLIVTNAGKDGVDENNLVDIFVHNFFSKAMMQSVDLSFSDQYVSLKTDLDVLDLSNLTDSSDFFDRFRYNVMQLDE